MSSAYPYLEGKHILAVDDEEDILETIEDILVEATVDTATTYESASQKIKENRYDLAILDILLPDMNGKAVYPFLMEARPNLKVIVCSGYSLEGPAQEILDAGAQGFVQKPFSLSTLSEKLQEAMRG